MRVIVTDRPDMTASEWMSKAKGLPDIDGHEACSNGMEIMVAKGDAEDLVFLAESEGFRCETEDEADDVLFVTHRLSSNHRIFETPRMRS